MSPDRDRQRLGLRDRGRVEGRPRLFDDRLGEAADRAVERRRVDVLGRAIADLVGLADLEGLAQVRRAAVGREQPLGVGMSRELEAEQLGGLAFGHERRREDVPDALQRGVVVVRGLEDELLVARERAEMVDDVDRFARVDAEEVDQERHRQVGVAQRDQGLARVRGRDATHHAEARDRLERRRHSGALEHAASDRCVELLQAAPPSSP